VRVRLRLRRWSVLLRNSEARHDFVLTQLGARDQEVFAIILLVVQRRFIEYVELFQGCVPGAQAHRREADGSPHRGEDDYVDAGPGDLDLTKREFFA
jgi:DNA repair protein RadC